MEVFNEAPIIGDLSVPNETDIKIRAKNSYASQNRAVTRQDYVSMVYMMPAKFGSVKRCRVDVDKDSFKRNINLYVVSEDFDQKLIKSNMTLKNNLRTWIQAYKMMGDTFDIVDPRIVNIGITYEVLVQEYFKICPEIGEALFLNDIYNILGNLDSIVDVTDVTVVNKHGGVHSDLSFEIRDHLSIDGRTLQMPFDHIYELKFPATDIRGTAI